MRTLPARPIARRAPFAALTGALLLTACGSGPGTEAGFAPGDTEPPRAGVVLDGPDVGTDRDEQATRSALWANWSGFSDAPADGGDPGSGIERYEWCAGTVAGQPNVVPWTSVGPAETGFASGLTLTPGATYYASVRAVDRAGNRSEIATSDGIRIDEADPGSGGGSGGSPGGGGGGGGGQPGLPVLAGLSATGTQKALDAARVWFDPGLAGGAHCWVFEGGEFGKAAVAWSGDRTADAKLLDQVRYVLEPGRGLTATGGFQDQKQVGTTAMFALVRNLPRIWNDLSVAEQERVTTMVQGALVSSAFTTSDKNPFVQSGTQQRAMNGDTNMNRDWNPNYRNGMVGTVVAATLFFGVAEADRLLRTHDHDAFVARCQTLGLTNLHGTYTASHPLRPTTAEIEGALHQPYTYRGIPLDEPLSIWLQVTEYTYGKTVGCGLNGGSGRVGSNGVRGGYVANCSGLPNASALGMLTEFDSGDGGGPRSSAHYANDGFYVNQYGHYLLVALGHWVDDGRSRAVLERLDVGIEDLRFKIDPSRGGGYHNFHSGKGYSNPYVIQDQYGHRINFAIADVLAAFHRG